jgi:hypothetical protein
MFQRTTAVCLHKVDFSETSQVLRFFTPDSGKINCIAKGAKRKKSAFLAPFELLSIYDLIRIEKRPGTLDILTKAERVRSFTKLRANYPSYVAACYAAEFVDEFAIRNAGGDTLLAGDAIARPRHGFQTLRRNRLLAFQADTVVAGIDAMQRVGNFAQKLHVNRVAIEENPFLVMLLAEIAFI